MIDFFPRQTWQLLDGAGGVPIIYADGQKDRDHLDDPSWFTPNDMRRAMRTLKRAVVRAEGSPKVLGLPFAELKGTYALYLHPDQLYDLMGSNDARLTFGVFGFQREPWMDEYTGLVGCWMGFTLFESLDLPTFTGTLERSMQKPETYRVLTAYAFAQDALAVHSGGVVEIIDPSHLVRIETRATP